MRVGEGCGMAVNVGGSRVGVEVKVAVGRMAIGTIAAVIVMPEAG